MASYLKDIFLFIHYHTVFQKKRANFETGYLEIVTIDFDDIWQKYSKYSRIVCIVQFSCRFALLSTFRLPNRTPKIMQILNASHCLSTWRHSVKKTNF